jgi:predicted transcriptional regulator
MICHNNGGMVVVGEFVCDEVFSIPVLDNGAIRDWMYNDLSRSCIPYADLAAYIGKEKTGHGWHISELKIYDKPKALASFNAPCPYKLPDGSRMDVPCPCDKYTWGFDEASGKSYCMRRIECPPQSWCYVEEKKEAEKR